MHDAKHLAGAMRPLCLSVDHLCKRAPLRLLVPRCLACTLTPHCAPSATRSNYAHDIFNAQRSSWRPVVYFNIVKPIAHVLESLESQVYFATANSTACSTRSAPPSCPSPTSRPHSPSSSPAASTSPPPPVPRSRTAPGGLCVPRLAYARKMKSSRTMGDSAYSGSVAHRRLQGRPTRPLAPPHRPGANQEAARARALGHPVRPAPLNGPCARSRTPAASSGPCSA